MNETSQTTIAILGAGPIGLEAALYARYLGYPVQVYERHQVASHVRHWGHIRMFTPFQMNCSPLGLAALAAQHPEQPTAAPDTLMTGQQWIDSYLQPLADTDLLRGHIRCQTEVLAISRIGALKTDAPGNPKRTEQPLRILFTDDRGETQTATAQIVLDTTGVFANPNWLGAGGAPACGEIELRDQICYEVPDLLDRDQSHYRDKHTLVVGGGYSAATTVTALAELQSQFPQTQVTWMTRKACLTGSSGPLEEIPNDSLSERSRLTQVANKFAIGEQTMIRHLGGVSVESIDYDPQQGQFQVQYETLHLQPTAAQQSLIVDRIIGNVGYRPDDRLFQELHVHQCYATSGPMKLATALMDDSTQDCLQQTTTGPETLLTPEPNFYILGSKSYGRHPHFLFTRGLDQIQQLFTIIGRRDDLNLYDSVRKLAMQDLDN
jgi:thioredoxin reductase